MSRSKSVYSLVCSFGLLLPLLPFSGGALLIGQESSEFHLFTNKEGQELEAKVESVSLETGKVTVVRRDGRSFELSGNLFSLDDQAFLKDWYRSRFGPPRGRLRFFGTLPDDRNMDVSLAEGYDDFVEVHALKDGWIARRAAGAYLFFSERKKGFTNLASVSANTVWFQATRKDGTVWSSPTNQIRAEVVTGMVRSAAGNGHAIGLRKDGSAVAWGNRYGDDPTELHGGPFDLREIVDIATTQHHVAAVDEAGTVYHWKAGEEEGESRSLGGGVVDVEGSIFDFLLLTRSGEVYQFGLAGLDSANVPVALESEGPFRKIRCNGVTKAAQKENGSWIAWGKNASGIVDHINGLGGAIDLALFSEPGASRDHGYVVWIESGNGGGGGELTPTDSND